MERARRKGRRPINIVISFLGKLSLRLLAEQTLLPPPPPLGLLLEINVSSRSRKGIIKVGNSPNFRAAASGGMQQQPGRRTNLGTNKRTAGDEPRTENREREFHAPVEKSAAFHSLAVLASVLLAILRA